MSRITDHAKELLIGLQMERDDADAESRPIVFVGHSLGGIIIKKALSVANSDEDARLILDSTYGIIFFATPPHGTNADDWIRLVSHVVSQNRPPGVDGLTNSMVVPATSELSQSTEESNCMLSGDHFGICKFSRNDQQFNQVLKGVQMLAENSKKAKFLSKLQREALNSLGVEEFRKCPLNVKHTPNTCEWISQRSTFQEWQDRMSKKDKLWIYGSPACGKTYLAKHIVKLEQEPQNVVVQCFFDEFLEDRKDVRAVFLSSLHQVLKSQPQLINKFIVPEYQSRKSEKIIWDIDILNKIWPKVVVEAAKYCRLTIVIDGLEQCSRYLEDLFNSLKYCEISLKDTCSVKLLLVARECEAIEHHSTGFSKYQVTFEDIHNDIVATVKEDIKTVAKIRRYTPSFTNNLCKAITNGADGMYLWASLVAKDIKHTVPSQANMENRLEKLPKGIMELYDSILGRISEKADCQKFLMTVFLWVVFGREVLKTEELRIGITLSNSSAALKTSKVDKIDIQRFMPEGRVKNLITQICRPLIKISSTNKVVLVHRSLCQFFTTPNSTLRMEHLGIKYHQDYYFETAKSHRDIGNLCVSYLVLDYFEDSGGPFNPVDPGPERWARKVRKRAATYQLASYAARNWAKHLEQSGEPLSLTHNQHPDRRILLDLKNQEAICWTEVWWFSKMWPRKLNYPGNELQIEDILEEGGKPSANDSDNPKILPKAPRRRSGHSRNGEGKSTPNERRHTNNKDYRRQQNGDSGMASSNCNLKQDKPPFNGTLQPPESQEDSSSKVSNGELQTPIATEVIKPDVILPKEIQQPGSLIHELVDDKTDEVAEQNSSCWECFLGFMEALFSQNGKPGRPKRD
ncbi:hypothetical protein B7463_g6894, partial [Scytalidium lignicola]